MDRTDSPKPCPAEKHQEAPLAGEAEPTGPSHDFEAQKRIHQQIRNDPDYDDWEYGTEPLPHEAWVAGRSGTPGPESSPAAP